MILVTVESRRNVSVRSCSNNCYCKIVQKAPFSEASSSTATEVFPYALLFLLSFAAFVSSSLSADESVRPDKDAYCLRR